MSDGPNMSGLSRKHIQQGCEASLKRLGIDCIDLYYAHRFDPHTSIEEMLSAFDLLVHQGKVRYIGARSMSAWKFALSLAKSDQNGWARFVAMQNHYNLIYREEEREMIPLCEAEGIAVVPWSPMARGLLAGGRTALDDRESTTRAASDKYGWKLYDTPSDWAVVEAVCRMAEERGVEPAQVALAWLLSKPTVAAPIVGATKLEHLDVAVKSVDVELSAEEIRALEAPYQPHGVRK
jgi:aryl-alcohol dehydrogenase-like predicted oxidoreductase